MKNRLHDRKAGIVILIVLMLITLAHVLSRVLIMKKDLLSTSDLGEYPITLLLAISILIMTVKGKDRMCYICYGAWLGYFVLDQIFELPGMIMAFPQLLQTEGLGSVDYLAFTLNILSMVGISAIGVLLVEYMNDGTIYNRAFNGFSLFTILVLVGCLVLNIISILNGGPIELIRTMLFNIQRIVMVVLFIFFAYDSAKRQLSKTDFTK